MVFIVRSNNFQYLFYYITIGMNGLEDFKNYAKKFKWKILATEHFTVSPLTHKVNATMELRRLRDKGTRVVILNCMAEFVPAVLEQACELDMIHDWVWILTDGAIDDVSFPCRVYV